MSEFCSLTLNANAAIADSDCYCTNNKSDERERNYTNCTFNDIIRYNKFMCLIWKLSKLQKESSFWVKGVMWCVRSKEKGGDVCACASLSLPHLPAAWQNWLINVCIEFIYEQDVCGVHIFIMLFLLKRTLSHTFILLWLNRRVCVYVYIWGTWQIEGGRWKKFISNETYIWYYIIL